MMNNNESRKLFKEFIKTNKLEHAKIDNRSCLKLNNKIHGFSTFSKDKIECRQFYEDYDALFAINIETNEVYLVQKVHLDIDISPNRIQPSTGRKAYSAQCEIKKSLKTNLKVFTGDV